MTITTWLMILALAAGSGTSPTTSATENGDAEHHCWVNGVWYNPCPADRSMWEPEPPPEPQPGS